MKLFLSLLIFSAVLSCSTVSAQNGDPANVGLSALGNFCDTCYYQASQSLFRWNSQKPDFVAANGGAITPQQQRELAQKLQNKCDAENTLQDGRILNTEQVLTMKLNVSDATNLYENKADAVNKYKYVDLLSQARDSVLNVKKANQAGLDSINRDFWKLSGNSFFANQIYKFGVKSGVDMSASTSQNYFDAANKIIIGLNVDSHDDYSANRAIMKIQSDLFAVNTKNGANTLNFQFDANTFRSLYNQFGFAIGYGSSGNVDFSMQGKGYQGGANFTSRIVASDKTAWLTVPWGGAASIYQNGDMFLNKESQRIYVKVDGNLKPVAFTTEVILKATTIPTSTSDTTGNVGDEISDANWKYIKTTAGWKRAALSTF